jgi:hypothetical protein
MDVLKSKRETSSRSWGLQHIMLPPPLGERGVPLLAAAENKRITGKRRFQQSRVYNYSCLKNRSVPIISRSSREKMVDQKSRIQSSGRHGRLMIMDDLFYGGKLFIEITGSRYINIRAIVIGFFDQLIFSSSGIDDK